MFLALPSSVLQQEPINRCPLAGTMTNWYVLIIETEKNGRLGMRLCYSTMVTTSSLPVCAKVIHNLVVVVYRIAIWPKSLSSHTMADQQQRKTLTYSSRDKERREDVQETESNQTHLLPETHP